MSRQLTVKRVERSRKWFTWFPWLFIVMGGLYFVGALRFGGGNLFLLLSATLYLILGLSSWGYLRWLGSSRKQRSAPAPALADGEVVLWRDEAGDLESRFGRQGGLILTDRRLAFEPVEDRFDPAVGREWPINELRSVRIEPLRLADGEVSSSTLVFDLGDDRTQRFTVFNSEAALATITAKLDELRGSRS